MKILLMNLRMQKGFGVAVAAHQIATGLSKLGFQVTLCSTNDSSDFEPKNYEWFQFPVYGSQQNRLLAVFQNEVNQTLKQLYKSKVLTDFNLVITFSFPFYGTGRILKIPEIHFDFGQAPTTNINILGRLNYQFLRWQELRNQARASKVFTISKFLTNYLHRRVTSPTVIKLGADQLLKTNINELEDLELNSDYCYGLYVGRLDPKPQPYKNIIRLSEMCRAIYKTHPHFKLICVGNASEETVRFLQSQGHLVFNSISDSFLAQIYQKCSMYVTATLWEGLDLPILEAAWFGKPAVAFNLGAHPELPVAGLVDTEEDWIDWVKYFVDNPELRYKHGRTARQQVAQMQYTWEACVEQIATEISNVLKTCV